MLPVAWNGLKKHSLALLSTHTHLPETSRGLIERRAGLGRTPLRARARGRVRISPSGRLSLLAMPAAAVSNFDQGIGPADIEIGAFLIATGNGPEKQELLRLIGSVGLAIRRCRMAR